MATATQTRTQAPTGSPVETVKEDPGFGAFWLLRIGFTAAPIIAGIDKFFDWMVEWESYLWSGVADALPGSAADIMYVVGGIEILAGILVLLVPRFGAPLVAAWLAGITANLVAVGIEDGQYWDIALRDFGLMLGAIALTMLAWKYTGPGRTGPRRTTS